MYNQPEGGAGILNAIRSAAIYCRGEDLAYQAGIRGWRGDCKYKKSKSIDISFGDLHEMSETP